MSSLYESAQARHSWSPALLQFARAHTDVDDDVELEALADSVTVTHAPARLAILREQDMVEGWSPLPHGTAVSSPQVNRALTGLQLAGATVPLPAGELPRWQLSQRVRAGRVRPAVAAFADQLRDRPGEHNDPKLRLAADLGPVLTSGDTVPLEKTDWMSSKVTNWLATTTVSDRDGQLLLDGRNLVADPTSRLERLATSNASNHIAGSVLGITLDGQLLLPARAPSKGAQYGALDPSGLGTLTLFDFEDASQNLLAYIINGLGRELAAACGVPHHAQVDMLVTGHSRNLALGGAPDFHALAVVACTASELDASAASNTGILTLTVPKDPTSLAAQLGRLARVPQVADRPLTDATRTAAVLAAAALTSTADAREWVLERLHDRYRTVR